MKNSQNRFWQIDTARGVAIVGMVVYHFLVDIEMLYQIPIGVFEMPLVLLARIVATLFIFLLGVAAVIKFEKIKNDGIKRVVLSFGKRAIKIGLWAGVISLVTYVMFPDNFIFFGILHFMAVSTILMIPVLKWKNNIGLVTLGIMIIALSFIKQNMVVFNFSSLDYFPLVPWFGVVVLGMVMGRIVKFSKSIKTNFFVKIGQKSLLIYLLHQPILWGGLWMLKIIILQ